MVPEMSLPAVVQRNNSRHYRIEQYPTAVPFNSSIQTKEANGKNCFPSKTSLMNTSTTLVCCTPSQPLHFLPYLENPFTKYQTAIFPPIDQQVSHLNVSENLNRFPNWPCHGRHLFQPLTEIQTQKIAFEQLLNLQTTNKSYIEHPPVRVPNFNGNLLKYHGRLNNFFNFVLNNVSLTDTHCITYLQNSVVEKARENIQAYCCDHAHSPIALKSL